MFICCLYYVYKPTHPLLMCFRYIVYDCVYMCAYNMCYFYYVSTHVHCSYWYVSHTLCIIACKCVDTYTLYTLCVQARRLYILVCFSYSTASHCDGRHWDEHTDRTQAKTQTHTHTWRQSMTRPLMIVTCRRYTHSSSWSSDIDVNPIVYTHAHAHWHAHTNEYEKSFRTSLDNCDI